MSQYQWVDAERFSCHSISHDFVPTGDQLPADERDQIDPELAALHKEWLQARDHYLGHLSAFSVDLRSTPPGVFTKEQKSCQKESKKDKKSKPFAVTPLQDQ